jgi:hypothetical protein
MIQAVISTGWRPPAVPLDRQSKSLYHSLILTHRITVNPLLRFDDLDQPQQYPCMPRLISTDLPQSEAISTSTLLLPRVQSRGGRQKVESKALSASMYIRIWLVYILLYECCLHEYI